MQFFMFIDIKMLHFLLIEYFTLYVRFVRRGATSVMLLEKWNQPDFNSAACD